MALVFDGVGSPEIDNGTFDNADNHESNLKLTIESSCSSPQVATNSNSDFSACDKVKSTFLSEFFTLSDLYKLSVRFYREKENKAFHVSYNDRSKLFALTKVVKYGNFKEFKNSKSTNNDVGFFDWVGNDLRDCWEDLGDMSKDEAMANFVLLLNSICPHFSAFIEAQRQKIEDQARLEQAEKEYKSRSEYQRKQIQEALNRQTLDQFTSYANQLHPNEPEQQQSVIQHLQEQHYIQYMQQIYDQQHGPYSMSDQNSALASQTAPNNFVSLNNCNNNSGTSINSKVHNALNHSASDDTESTTEENGENPSNPEIAPASIWTRKDIKQFKELVKKECSESIITVSHGETVTVRVPTHEEGTCLFWEFATDDYDIGFGLCFEWTIAESNTVTVHVTESDEDEYDENGEVVSPGKKREDVEVGQRDKDLLSCKPQTDEILPIYRRDCHEEVYAGSHVYPGRGVYLLKFDNTYSLWRSKRLYYRVYYSK